MKNLLITLSCIGVAVGAIMTVSAAHSSNYTGSSYAKTSYQGGYSYQYSYGLAVGSYTIGCTTYYYNTTTGATVGKENICKTPSRTTTYQHSSSYSYPINYSYPVQTSYPVTTSYPVPTSYPVQTSYPVYSSYYPYNSSQYCYFDSVHHGMNPCDYNGYRTGAGYYDDYYYDDYQDYLNCHYDNYGSYVCW